jgi:hypothetical protein
MVRAVVLVSVALGSASCRPSGSPVLATPIGHSSSTSVAPARTPLPSPTHTLAALHHADVTIEGSLPVPGGTAKAYSYVMLESRIGELAAQGRDVKAELAAEQGRCEEQRAVLEPDEQESIELWERSCEELAAATLLDDDQLSPECHAVGVAYFDLHGVLLDRMEIDGPCLDGANTFEAYDLTPAPHDELLLVATSKTLGEQTRGGWGAVQQSTSLHVLSAMPALGGDEAVLVEDLEVELDVSYDGGACGHGIRRSLQVAAVGVLEVFSREWNECGDEGCIDPALAEAAAEDGDTREICRKEPVTVERATWRAEAGEWGPLEPMEVDVDELPDGIVQ